MRIGVPKEIKDHESRVGLTPASVRELTAHGHTVVVQRGAAAEIGFPDDRYVAAGAEIVDTADAVFAAADMIVKVKEPQPVEIARLRQGQILFTYLHLAADRAQTEGLMKSGAVCIAYETVTDARGALPLLAPMSEVAGRMSVQVGAHYLLRTHGGEGVLLGGVPGVPPGKVVVLGGGVSGTNAARMAMGLEAEVAVIDRSLTRLKELDLQFGARLRTMYATTDTIEHEVLSADVVVGAVLVPGAAAPKLVTKEMVHRMRPGTVLVDISIDQGGCFETSRPTSHADPVYVVDGVTHYCVTNMPGAVARTSTLALYNATLPFALAIAGKGWRAALRDDPHLLAGLNVCEGHVTHPAVAESLGLAYQPARSVVAGARRLMQTIPARRGRATHVARGQSIRIVNTHGNQVVDTWAFTAGMLTEFMSMEHTRATLTRLIPRVGDGLYTNRRRKILTLAEDTSQGHHDTLIAACDSERYILLGVTEYHDNCTDNLFAAMQGLGLTPPECPSPLNLFMNIPWTADGELSFAAPTCKPGDYVVLRAELDCIVAMSACPQDILPINRHTATEAHFELLG